ncbi:MAG: MCE family protein [Bacteroidetes bacterium]|nr:MCE family protein [Bacteroidota bacterium]
MKIALLAIAALALAIWGFKFLKGINILTPSRVFYVKYDFVDQLRASSPVYIKGFQVGMVKSLYVDKTDDKTIVAVLNIDQDVDIPKDAVATIIGLSLMGGKGIELVIPHPCEGDCAVSGDFLKGDSKSFLQTVIGDPSQIDAYTDRLQVGLTNIWDSIADPNDPRGAGRSIVALEKSLKNIEVVTAQVSVLLEKSTKGIAATVDNAAQLTRMLNANSQDISNTLANLSAVSAQLKQAGLDKTSQKAAQAIDSITSSLTSLRGALQSTTQTIQKVDVLASKLSNGEGSAGKLLADPGLYDNLVRSSRQLHLLMQDLRLNPKRYNTVKLKILGKNKTPGYVNPLADPAYERLVDSLERAYNQRTGH